MTVDSPDGATSGATIYSVAEAAGVSIATVSRVLRESTTVSERTRAKVLEAVERLDYLPRASARNLAVRQHEALGLVLPELSGPYYSELLMGFEEAAGDLDLSVVVSLGDTHREGLARFTRLAAGVDGIAVLGGTVPDGALERAARLKPVVVVAGHGSDHLESLAAENTTSARALTEHLLTVHGRRRPVFVGDPALAPDVRQRADGFALAVAAAGLPVPEPLGAGLRERDGHAVAERLVRGEVEADAVVCANDEIALALMDRLHDAGRRVPEDLAVVGWDDIMAARYVRPGLSTVRQPVRELGALAARRLHERVTGGAARPTPTVLETRLVLRGSCGCADERPAPH